MIRIHGLSLALLASLVTGMIQAGDWPQWGGTDGRNMASDAKGLPDSFDPGPKLPGGSFDVSQGKNVLWATRLGSVCCGSPTIAGGKVFVGTNNVYPRDPKYKNGKDGWKAGYGVVMCFEEAGGKFLWQCCLPAIPSQMNANMFYAQLGVCSSPLIHENRVYFVSNRGEVLCLTTDGLAGGKNEGSFKDEALLYAPFVDLRLNPELVVGNRIPKVQPGKPIWVWKPGKAVPLGPTDADVLWRYDMVNELPCWVQDAASCSLLADGDYVYVCTPNGVDQSHRHLPSAEAPSILVMDKKTGKIVAADDARIGPRILHGSWSSLSKGQVNGKTLLFFGGPDGVCYAFDAKPLPAADPNQRGTIRKVWSFDGNLPQNRFTDPRKCNYASHSKPGAQGPSEYIATPVFHQGRVYIANGQDPVHGLGPSVLSCIDAAKEGDVTDSARVWQYTGLDRTMSSVSILDGLLFIGDGKGQVHCLDLATGRPYWVFPTRSQMWGSTLAADGKVYFGNEKGDFYVLAAAKEFKVLSKHSFGHPIRTTPVVANGVLYVTTNQYLFAIQAAGK